MQLTRPRSSAEPHIRYHYVVVREDLPLGVLAAQLTHAAGESSTGDLTAGTYAVVLAVKNEQHLLATADELRRAGVAFVLIEEPAEPWCGAAMAIGLTPTYNRQPLQRVLGRLPLLRQCGGASAKSA